MRTMFLKRFFRSPFIPLYDEARLAPDIRRGLRFVILGNLCGNLFATITTGATLTGYAGMLGANDFVFGVLTAIPFLGTIAQIPAAYIVSKTQKRREYMLRYGAFARLLWVIIGLIPLIIPEARPALRLWSVIFLAGISSISSSFINVSFTSWLADLLPIRMRGRWLSGRDRIISVVGITIGLISAQILDMASGFTGYVIVLVMGGIFGLMDMAFITKVPDVPMKKRADIKYSQVLKSFFADKPFFRFTVFWTLWCFTSNFAGPYYNRYALGPLGLSFMQVTLYGQVAAAIMTVLLISKWGRVIDRYGSKPTLWVSCVATSFIPVIMVFSQPGSFWTFLLFNAIGSAFWIAANLAAHNLLLSLSPPDQRPSYIAIFSCFNSIAGSFLGILLGGATLEWMPDIFAAGAFWDKYKVIFMIGFLSRLAATLACMPGISNDSEGSIADMKEDFLLAARRRLALFSPRKR
ncbi:MAG: MFS transporter [Christensenellales bacterium]